ncbi:hypothetical protein PVAP13_1NG059305 [Panicum virgatum]|uniref:Uncharacterized protein n=1 Tax=Panicum virgatum TaxID=38727 RepID=A0A8T0WT50_PANVG|nr:hypothetical protein PVAP13_1NG059305 [Panicum virgatum]
MRACMRGEAVWRSRRPSANKGGGENVRNSVNMPVWPGSEHVPCSDLRLRWWARAMMRQRQGLLVLDSGGVRRVRAWALGNPSIAEAAASPRRSRSSGGVAGPRWRLAATGKRMATAFGSAREHWTEVLGSTEGSSAVAAHAGSTWWLGKDETRPALTVGGRCRRGRRGGGLRYDDTRLGGGSLAWSSARSELRLAVLLVVAVGDLASASSTCFYLSGPWQPASRCSARAREAGVERMVDCTAAACLPVFSWKKSERGEGHWLAGLR